MKPQDNLDSFLDDMELNRTLDSIHHTVVVLSGKGGVGKSTIAANLALSLALAGRRVGILDIDFHGPSIPKLFGLEGRRVETNEKQKLVPLEYAGTLKVMSLGLLLQGRDDAVIWRGPMKMGAIKQLLKDVDWGELDYLVVDSPPGTGDEPLSIVQLIKNISGAVVVTTPQDLSLSDVRRSLRFCEKLQLPVIGVIENMSGFICPHCGESSPIFKTGGGETLASEMGVDFLGRVPIEPDIVLASDSGQPYVYQYGKSQTAKNFENMVAKLLDKVEKDDTDSASIDESAEEKAPKAVAGFCIAVPTQNGDLAMHFGHCEKFMLFEVDRDKKEIRATRTLTPPPHEPGVLPQWLSEQKVDLVLAGGMGVKAQELFRQNGLELIVGVQGGKAEQAVKDFLNGNLQTGDNLCSH
ncbi:P-loop NTPase [candidate division KSB1 bacterium]|nr:P-loop NTPase [candidate division KSB1 bacterium]